MKILLIVHTFLPKYLGGTEVCTYELAKEYKRLGHEVMVFCSDPLSRNDDLSVIEFYYQGIKVYTIPKNIIKYKNFINTYSEKKVIKPFQKLLKKFKPDIIHYHHLMHLSLDLVKIAKKNKIPQVITLHDYWFQCLTHQRITTRNKLCLNYTPQKCAKCLFDILNSGPITSTTFSLNTFLNQTNKLNYFLNLTKKIFIRSFGKIKFLFERKKYTDMVKKRNMSMKQALKEINMVILPTKFLAKEFKKWGINNNSIQSSDGINTGQFKNFKKKTSKTLRFVYIGSIIHNKGLDLVLKAWPKLDKGNYNLKIYGNLKTDKKYANQINKLSKGLKNIKFCGTFTPNDISKIYSEIDVLLVPSRWFENAPLVLRNTRLVKIPAIVANIGSMPELVQNNKNGYLYENENILSLAEKMNFFIKDPSLQQKLTKNITKQKSIKDNVSELTQIYQKLIKENVK